MGRQRVSVTKESNTGRNLGFHDNYKGSDMTRSEFVREINNGNYENYHVRSINGIPTPVSNPDSKRNNNLG
ncbi:hypothetical protein [Aliarcobacter cryaerophilus]|uniref:DUF3892 domain-containing protein n=1 Tax=Aliarcobacter cryaerophilus TaxID=28198 RepID=A0A2S9TMK6_9BACT|nr:hypothetical protein [Aliarcobacter cryaerophilus]PRN00064.1 hypothetical protein CJ668_08620 [Arcobacter cryaerophilus gv. pseudocryaerophilus]